jgi:hypothetical protein
MSAMKRIIHIPSTKMILYTEKQLRQYYRNYIRLMPKKFVKIPTLEEYRVMFEEYWAEYYEQQEGGDPSEI